MEEERIIKKKGVALVKKRLKELLKPLGFQPYPHSSTRLVRVRDAFIDEVSLDTGGYHLDPFYHIYCRFAPFAGLHCDAGRLWRTARNQIETHLFWHGEFPRDGGLYYYKPKEFEAVWRDVAFVLERYILPQMEAMTEEHFLDSLLNRSQNGQDFFLAHQTVYLTNPYATCNGEAAAYGVEQWRLGNYEKGLPFLEFAQKKYRLWLEGEQSTSQFYRWCSQTLDLLGQLLALWENKREGWELAAQERIRQVSVDWIEYLL